MMTGDFGGSSSPVIGSPPQLFPILPAWEPKHSLLWGQQAICMEHRLHEHPLFSPESLATLIEHFGGLSGREVTASIANGILISSPAAKVSGLLEPKRRQRRPITFHLDPRKPGTIVEVT